jgi:hypothetical protein
VLLAIDLRDSHAPAHNRNAERDVVAGSQLIGKPAGARDLLAGFRVVACHDPQHWR